MTRLQDRIALVTGGGRGIGRAIALSFAREGAVVACAARSSDQLASVVDEIEAAGGRAMAFAVDLLQREQTFALVDRVKAELGAVEILVNNAGLGSSSRPMPFVEFDTSFWDQSLELNLTVPMLLSRAALPDMLAAGSGRIITTASIAGRIGSVHGAAYSAGKHGVLGLMRTIAKETAGTGVTANCICPGPVKTIMNDRRIEYDAQRLGRDLAEHERGLTPIGGRAEPEDIAPMAVYLASDDARFITGQAYNIDGGVVMS